MSVNTQLFSNWFGLSLLWLFTGMRSLNSIFLFIMTFLASIFGNVVVPKTDQNHHLKNVRLRSCWVDPLPRNEWSLTLASCSWLRLSVWVALKIQKKILWFLSVPPVAAVARSRLALPLLRDWQSEKSPPLAKCHAKQWVHFLFLGVPSLCLFPMLLPLPFLEFCPLKLMLKNCAVALKLLTTFTNSPWHWAIEYSILLCRMLIRLLSIWEILTLRFSFLLFNIIGVTLWAPMTCLEGILKGVYCFCFNRIQ